MIYKNIWFILVPLILFAMLAICIVSGVTLGSERWAYNEAVDHMSPTLNGIIKAITYIGDSAVVSVICLLFFIIGKTQKTIAWPISVAVIFSFILNIVLKHLFAQERPDILRLINETSYSFPSGHAMINASLYTIIKNKPRKVMLSVFCALIIIIGYSRVYLGVHYAGDVLGGWIIGLAVSVFVYYQWNNKFYYQKEPFK